VDEAHGAAALETSRVLSKFSAEYFMGLSGTPTRKISSQDQVFRMLIGPVIYKAQVERLVPKIKLLTTGYNSGVQMSRIKTQYARMITKLETDTKRNEVICEAIVKAVKNGHSVMVPMSRIKAIDDFAKQLDAAMTRVNPTESLVTVFHGSLHKKVRDANLAKIKSGEAKVIVGNISLLSTGLNIPRLSMLVERMTITSNLPKCQQRTARILTPLEGKKQPVILMLLDNCPLQRITARKEFTEAILPVLKPIMSTEDMQAFQEWSGASRNSAISSSTENEDGVRRWGASRANEAPKQRFSNEFYEFSGGKNAL
jgi:superfamily II DNA or RNA helicase